MKRLTARIVPLLCAGCAAAPAPIAAPSPSTVPTLGAGEFPGLPDRAFDARSDDPTWQSGDAVVFALRLRKGDEVRRWLLRLEVLVGEELVALQDNGAEGTIAFWQERTWEYEVTVRGEREQRQLRSRVLLVGVHVADEQGRELTRSVVQLPSTFLGRGLLPAIEQSLAAAASAAPAPLDAEPVVGAMLGAMSLLHVVQEDDALATYFWQVVEKPSVWSLLTNLGVRATLSMPFEQSVRAERLPDGLPPTREAFLVPLRIDVNGSPALLADVLACDASRPYALSGGMIAATARHPSDADLTFELQLVSARCGSSKPKQVKLQPHQDKQD